MNLQNSFTFIRALITSICFIFIVIYGLYPTFSVDNVSIALIIIMIFPWILPYIKTLKLPGELEITTKEVAKLEQTIENSEISSVKKKLSREGELFTRWDIFNYDPNLALAALRIDIEKKLREIAKKKNINVQGISLGRISDILHDHEVIAHNEFEVLKYINAICNKAVHAEKVDEFTARKILDIGESIIIYLDSLKREK